MKKIFFLVCFGLFLNNAHSTAQQPATIDYETVGNDWTWTVFANGAAQSPTDYSVVENPLDGVINSSAHVAKLVVATDASRWAGVITADIPPLTLDENNCVIKVLVYKDVVTTFQIGLKVNADDEDEIAVQVSNTTTARWEELSFDFSGHIGKTFASMVIIPDFATGARSYGSINYWDDISFNSKTPVDPTGKIDFETRGNTWTWRVFSNGSTQSPTDFSVSPNPLKAGINTSAAVAKFVAHPDAARWAGVYTSNISSIKFDAANCIIKVMVYKNVVSPFQIGFKFNEEDEETDVDVQVLNTSTSGWEELIFDFTEQIGKTYACMVIIPDFAEDTRSYGSVNYWDNISFSVVSGISSNKVQQLDFFPNPFNEVLNIKTDADIVSLTISNLAGQTIKRIYSNGSERSFDVRDLSSGTYIAALKTKDGKTFTQKIVKL